MMIEVASSKMLQHQVLYQQLAGNDPRTRWCSSTKRSQKYWSSYRKYGRSLRMMFEGASNKILQHQVLYQQLNEPYTLSTTCTTGCTSTSC